MPGKKAIVIPSCSSDNESFMTTDQLFLQMSVNYKTSFIHTHTMYMPKYVYMCCMLSRVQFFATPWTVAWKASLSMEFSRQEYWSGFPFPAPGDLPDPRIAPKSPALSGGSLPLSHLGSPHSGLRDQALKLTLLCFFSMFLWNWETVGKWLSMSTGLFHFIYRIKATPLQYSSMEIPWAEEPGGPQSTGSQSGGHN